VGEAADMRRPLEVVPAGCWQAARTTGEYTLVGCTVAPGFEFADFRLLKDYPEEATKISDRFPCLAALI
jgi:predicted cupin superfamily sugar epimerase